jgi:hypothetical protein
VDSYNIPDRKNFAAVDSLAPAIGEIYQVTSGENHSGKALHLRPLKKHFKRYLESNEKVKLIFVVPPNRFGKFSKEKYIFPEIKEKSVKGNKEAEGKCEVKTDKSHAELIEELNEWVEQYVMEVNVDPLVTTFDRRIESQNKKSFRDAWGKIGLKSKN